MTHTGGIHIPFMLLQPFIENALWHGLIPKKDGRELSIKFKRLDAFRIFCIIEDNGIGREEAAKRCDPLKNKSLAINFIRQRLDLIKRIKGIDCGFTIHDKRDEHNNSLGTRVEIILPILN